jgi:hypothetical protein
VPAIVLLGVAVVLFVVIEKELGQLPKATLDYYAERDLPPPMTYRSFFVFICAALSLSLAALSGVGWWVRRSMPAFLEQQRRDRDRLIELHDTDTARRVRARRRELDELDERLRARESLLVLSQSQLLAIRETFSETLDVRDREKWLSRQGEMLIGGVVGALLGYLASGFLPSF